MDETIESPLTRPARASLGALLTAATLVAAGCGGPSDETDEPRSLLLLTLDTTIPEALSCYVPGPGRSTPALDAIAAEGLLFENARTVTPMTLPSHASMLTGLVPPRHSVRMNGAMILPESADTLAERARAAGAQTAAFVAAVVLGEGFGLEQGFDVYDQPAAQVGSDERLEAARDARQMVDVTLDWFRDQRDPERPFFVWLHFFDPHAPYAPPPEYLQGAGGNAYQGEVNYMDAQIGRLIDELKTLELWDETLVAVVSDHGEGLGRHGQKAHAAFVFDTTIRVPMLLRHPDGRRAGEREAAPTSVVDLFPTLVHELGWGLAGDVDGIDLWRENVPADRGVYFESYYGYLSFGWSPITGWADGDGKFHHASRPELYDLQTDPGELANLLPGAEDRAEDYRDGLARIGRRERLAMQGVSDESGKIGAQIEALGYTGGVGLGDSVPEPTEHVALPSPHERIEAYAKFQTARELQTLGRNAEAVPLLEEVVAGNPRNHSAAFNLGLGYMAMREYEKALAAIDLSIEHRRGEWMGGVLNKAVCLQNLGRGADAVPFYEQAFTHGDGPPRALETFVRLLDELGETEKRDRYARRLLEQRSGTPEGN